MLVVEDNPSVLKTTIRILRRLGYSLIEAQDGMQAVDIRQSDIKIDILFSDVSMPNGMSGLELVEKARSFDPNLRVLMTSGHAVELWKDRFAEGKIAFIAKPYMPNELSNALTALLEQGDGAL